MLPAPSQLPCSSTVGSSFAAASKPCEWTCAAQMQLVIMSIAHHLADCRCNTAPPVHAAQTEARPCLASQSRKYRHRLAAALSPRASLCTAHRCPELCNLRTSWGSCRSLCSSVLPCLRSLWQLLCLAGSLQQQVQLMRRLAGRAARRSMLPDGCFAAGLPCTQSGDSRMVKETSCRRLVHICGPCQTLDHGT